MKVAVIPTIRAYPWGAPGHCMGELVRALSRAGHEVLWLVAPIDLRHPEVEKLARLDVRVVSLPEPPANYVRFPKIRNRLRRWRHSSRLLLDIINAFDPQHLFLNQGGTWCGLQEEFWPSLTRGSPYSLICHLNRPQPPFVGPWFERAKRLMQGARKVYFPSAWTRHLAEIQIGVALPNAARFQYPMRFSFAEPLPWPQAEFPRLAMVCRLDTFHKGMDVALEALARLHREGMRFSLNIYGTGGEEGYLRELTRFLEIEKVVSFAGYTAELQQVWLKEEMLLLPSRFEGSAVAITEALGLGRPVLITPVGGAAEWIEDGVNGYVCPAPEVKLLDGTLRRALAERSRWPEMGRRAHEKVRRDLDPDPAAVFLQALAP